MNRNRLDLAVIHTISCLCITMPPSNNMGEWLKGIDKCYKIELLILAELLNITT